MNMPLQRKKHIVYIQKIDSSMSLLAKIKHSLISFLTLIKSNKDKLSIELSKA